jgi:hypothetical protein
MSPEDADLAGYGLELAIPAEVATGEMETEETESSQTSLSLSVPQITEDSPAAKLSGTSSGNEGNLTIKPLVEESVAKPVTSEVAKPALTQTQVDAKTPDSKAIATQTAPAAEVPKVPATMPLASKETQTAELVAIYKVRVGPYADKASADAASGKLKEIGMPTMITSNAPYYVQIGAFSNKTNAEKLKDSVEKQGFAVIIVN